MKFLFVWIAALFLAATSAFAQSAGDAGMINQMSGEVTYQDRKSVV